MNAIKLLIVLGLIGGGYQYWKEHKEAPVETAAGPVVNGNGFTALPPVDGASTGTVLVVAAENCPSDAAQRADRLADDLSRKGIPVVRTHNANFSLISVDADNSVPERITSIMNGPLPIVFVNGRAKSNPTLEEVVAEYNGAHR